MELIEKVDVRAVDWLLSKLSVEFIISHKTDQLYDKFANVIKFEKHKNFSKVA